MAPSDTGNRRFQTNLTISAFYFGQKSTTYFKRHDNSSVCLLDERRPFDFDNASPELWAQNLLAALLDFIKALNGLTYHSLPNLFI